MKAMILSTVIALTGLIGLNSFAGDYFTVYPTYAEADANCNDPDWVTAAYDRDFKLIGYMCTHVGTDN